MVISKLFEKEDVGEGETGGATYNLNTPKHRVKAGISYYPSKVSLVDYQ